MSEQHTAPPAPVGGDVIEQAAREYQMSYYDDADQYVGEAVLVSDLPKVLAAAGLLATPRTTPADETARVEWACEIMHDAYEAAAVREGWETQERSRKPWADVPEANRATMRGAVGALLTALATSPADETALRVDDDWQHIYWHDPVEGCWVAYRRVDCVGEEELPSTRLATTPAGETAERAARVKAASLYPLDGEAPDVIFALRSAFRAGAEFALAASPADADTADGLDPEVAARWAGCDRAEAIRQAEANHAEMLRWGRLFEQMRDERDARGEQIAQAIEAARPGPGSERGSLDIYEGMDRAARIAREHAASQPVAATSEEESRG